MKGLRSNEDTLFEILETRSNNSIVEIKRRLSENYTSKDLIKKLKVIILVFSEKFE